MSYLCRSFDQLYQGELYSAAKPAIHIGFLNFHPFPDFPEFYATYKLTNQKNGMVYSDKFSLSVIDLTCIELATSEDKVAHLDIWAKFFTSTTWEEVIMIAEYHPHIEAAAQALYEANADEMTKRKCRARRDYYKQKNTTEKMIHDLTESMEQKTKALEQISAELEQKDARIKELEALLASQNSH